MKKIALMMTLVLLTIACQKKEEDKGYVITANTVGFEDGETVFVNVVSASNRPSIVDSTTIKDGKFKIALPPVETIDFNYLTFKSTNGNVLYLGENNPIKMTIYKDSLRSSLVEGGKENTEFFAYVSQIRKYGEKMQQLKNQFTVSSKLKETDKLSALRKQQADLQAKEKAFRKETATNNTNSIVGLLALNDLVNLKIMPAKKAKEIFEKINDTLKTTRVGKTLNATIAQNIGKIDIGSVAEHFVAPTPDGKKLSLKDAMGEITILDFWASWCKPCRMENPNVVRVYNKYHDKGLNIVGVSLDKKQESWTKAIADDNLEWNHVSNLKFWQEPIARAYGVRSIPATFILDKEGNVIAKNLRGPALEAKIEELLGEKTL